MGYELLYEVSSHGRVRRIDTGRVQVGSVNKKGYHRVKLTENGKSRSFFMHRLVAEAFIGGIPEGHDVNHKNGDKLKNRVTNLEILTHQDNMRHAFYTGLAPVGSRRANAKLTERKVVNIKRKLEQGVAKATLAFQYGVHPKTIHEIHQGKRWNHV